MRRLSLEPFGHVSLSREGSRLVTESLVSPRFPRPPLHVHPGQSERFAVSDGALRLSVGGAALLLRAGDAVTVPAGVPHTFAVHGERPVRLTATFDPALDMEAFFVGLHRLVADGHIDASGRPRSAAVAPFARRHLHLFRLARVPAVVQRAVVAAVSAVPRADT